MYLNRRPDTSVVRRMATLAAAIVLGVLAAPVAPFAQSVPPPAPLQGLPACSVTPLPQGADGYPIAVLDLLSSADGVPVAFSGASLLANDIGTGLTISGVAATSASGGTITGTNPFVYTPAPLFAGEDVFSYELVDPAGLNAIGIVHVAVTRDLIAPAASITAPLGGTLSGNVLVTASASDNVGVAGVRLLVDGINQIGAELTAAPYQATWDTTLVADGSHLLTAVARDAAGNIGTSASVAIIVRNTSVAPNVIGLSQAAAQSAITAAGLTVGTITTVNDAAPAGQVISQSPAGGTSVAPASSVAITVSLGPVVAPPATGPAVDVMVFAQGAGTRTTPAFSTTSPGDVLVAFVGSDGPAASNSQTVTVSGAGLTWSRVQRSASQFGDAEIWTATASGILTGVTVKSVQAVGALHQSLTVIAFSGVTGIGASSIAGAASGAPTIGLTTQGAGSLVYGVGNAWDRAIARTIPAGQTKVREFVDTAVGDTFWVQSITGPVAAAGTSVTLNATAPTTDQWNLAAVELLAGAVVPPVMVTVPSVVGLTQADATAAITGATLTVGTVTTQNSATPAGQVISQNPAGGSSAVQSSAVSFVVSAGPAPVGTTPVIEATVFADGTGPRTTPAFSTASAGDVLVALVASDGPTTGTNTQNMTVSGAGLAWTRVQRAATSRGVAEIWTATAPTALTNVTVSSTQSVTVVLGGPVNQSLTVLAFANASGIGASNIKSAASGAANVSLVAQAAGSLVFGVGNDFDQAIARTVGAGQTKIHEFLAPTGDTFWMQRANAATSAAGATVTLNDTAPTADQWNFAIVEIKR